MIVAFSDDVLFPAIVNKLDIVELGGLNQKAVVFRPCGGHDQVIAGLVPAATSSQP